MRSEHYESLSDLKLENKFAVVPLTIQLDNDINMSLEMIPKATQKIRSSFGEVYATFFMSQITLSILPYFLANWFLNLSTLPFTLAFSNTPGLLK